MKLGGKRAAEGIDIDIGCSQLCGQWSITSTFPKDGAILTARKPQATMIQKFCNKNQDYNAA